MEKLKSLYVGSPPFLTVLGKRSCLTLNHQQEHIFDVAFPTYVSANSIGTKTARLQSLSLSKILETPIALLFSSAMLPCNVNEVT